VLVDRFKRIERAANSFGLVTPRVSGRLTRIRGLLLEVSGVQGVIGEQYLIDAIDGSKVECEVVGFDGDNLFMMPLRSHLGFKPGAKVSMCAQALRVPVGDALFGRVINGLGEPLDTQCDIDVEAHVTLTPQVFHSFKREKVCDAMDVGVKVINALLTVGKGQRIGVISDNEEEQNKLISMMARFAQADVVVLGLIGGRRQELEALIERVLDDTAARSRCVVVASTIQDAAMMRLRSVSVAHRIAEFYRDKGKSVLLICDSLTRYAKSQREVAFSVGEAISSNGFPPTCLSKISELVDRAGSGNGQRGSITAFYSAIAEQGVEGNPVVEAIYDMLDGHILLSGVESKPNSCPEIDILSSISRVMPDVVDAEHLNDSQRFRSVLSKYEQENTLLSGATYGHNDEDTRGSMENRVQRLLAHIQQDIQVPVSIDAAKRSLNTAILSK